MFFDIVFHKQIYSDYSPAACVQMLTNTSATQQDIYFKMMRVAQSLTNKQCVHKAQFHDLKGPIVGPRERTCILLEETLNHFKTNSFIWHVAYCKKFEIAPALVIFHPRKGFMNQMLKGHPVIVTKNSGDIATIYDPSNEIPITASIKKLKPFVDTCYSLKATDSAGNFIEL